MQNLFYFTFLFKIIIFIDLTSDACALISSAIRNSVETVRPRRVVGHVDNIDSIANGTPHPASETGAYIHPSFFLKAHSKMPQNQNDQIRLLTVSSYVSVFIVLFSVSAVIIKSLFAINVGGYCISYVNFM